jgi:SDR family mycofactocin-dependent oxidoreductase
VTRARFAGRVALVTGAARGQGRAHAVRLAQEGADVIVTDLAARDDADGLAATAAEVERTGRRTYAGAADIRDGDALRAVVDAGVAALGRLDVVVANAGVVDVGPALDVDDEAWRRTVDVNLTGAWNTCRAALPHLLAAGGGAIVLTGSTQAVRPTPGVVAYAASKHGVTGLMKALAIELAEQGVRVNAVHPTTVRTPMLDSYSQGMSDEQRAAHFTYVNALPVPWVESDDVSNAVLFLASEEARYVTGAELLVDAGAMLKGPRPPAASAA